MPSDITFRCEHPAEVCDNTDTWKASPKDGAGEREGNLLVKQSEAACPSCGAIGTAKARKTVVVLADEVI